MRPTEADPDPATRARERAELRAFCHFILAVVVIGNVGFWIALSLLPTPPPRVTVVAPSLPAVLLAALTSARPSIPEASSAAPSPSIAPPRRASSRGEIINPQAVER